VLRKLNEKYDNLKNYRFLIFMGLMSPGFILMGVFSATQNPIFYGLGIVYLAILGGFRIYYVEFMRNKKEKS